MKFVQKRQQGSELLLFSEAKHIHKGRSLYLDLLNQKNGAVKQGRRKYLKDMTGQLEDVKFNSSSILDNLGRTAGS